MRLAASRIILTGKPGFTGKSKVLPVDCGRPVWPDRDNCYRYPCLLLNIFNIIPEFRGEFIPFLASSDISLPSGHGSVVECFDIMQDNKGSSVNSCPLTVYEVQTFISLKPDSTSAFIMKSRVTPLTIMAYFSAGRSSHPHRRGLPVVDPYSLPRSRIIWPSSSSSSVGNGPLPTLVQYALKMPKTSPVRAGCYAKARAGSCSNSV